MPNRDRIRSSSGTLTPAVPGVRRYLPDVTLPEYVELVRRQFPELYPALWFERPGADAVLDTLAETQNEFETDDDGRGDSYRRAQENLGVRATGIRQLLALAAGTETRSTCHLLDLLGGDGTFTRLLPRLEPLHRPLSIVTSDIAAQMVHNAVAAGLPAIRQPAQFLFLHEASFDAVVVAYGFHHIAPDERLRVCKEAFRVLRPGGRLVLHDFEDGSPVANWFQGVVHNYSAKGHSYDHFTREELRRHLGEAGFADVRVEEVYDPFVVHAGTEQSAFEAIADYALDMYGLVGLRRAAGTDERARDAVWELVLGCFRYDLEARAGWAPRPSISQRNGGFVGEIPRVAIVGHGRKPGTSCAE